MDLHYLWVTSDEQLIKQWYFKMTSVTRTPLTSDQIDIPPLRLSHGGT